MKKKSNDQKHLTEENRAFIESSLNENHTIREIAKFLSKDPTTISKEIKRNRQFKEPSTFGGYSNICLNRYDCDAPSICTNTSCNKQCHSCRKCNSSCKLFKPEICPMLKRAPHVCNGCPKKNSCRLEKFYYRSRYAQTKYESLRKSSREGINLSEDELTALNELTVPLVKKGQPISHIFSKHKEDIPCTSRTFYSYVEKGYLSLGNIDLRRKVRYKKRKLKKVPCLRRNGKILLGRTYTDFTNFIIQNNDLQIVEMDTVEGTKGGKVLLTLFFRNSKIMLIKLLANKSQEAVIQVFNQIEEAIGTEIFRQTFPLILTDNGSEFLDPVSLETSCKSNEKRTSLFYCDPNSSFQKGGIEKNHEYIRYVVPKGNTFNNFNQSDMDILMNHINNTARDNLNNHTPMECSNLFLHPSIVEFFRLKNIHHDEICLTPKLLSKNF